jgi:hypothetical protein
MTSSILKQVVMSETWVGLIVAASALAIATFDARGTFRMRIFSHHSGSAQAMKSKAYRSPMMGYWVPFRGCDRILTQ